MTSLEPLMNNHDRPASLDLPGATHRKTTFPGEKWAWLFMRYSGIALVFLALGHVFIMLAWDSRGVHRINGDFIAHRWSNPLWQLWDITMLWLAELHGANGIRTIISDYAKNDKTKFYLKFLLVLSMILVLGCGSYALLTFNSTKNM